MNHPDLNPLKSLKGYTVYQAETERCFTVLTFDSFKQLVSYGTWFNQVESQLVEQTTLSQDFRLPIGVYIQVDQWQPPFQQLPFQGKDVHVGLLIAPDNACKPEPVNWRVLRGFVFAKSQWATKQEVLSTIALFSQRLNYLTTINQN